MEKRIKEELRTNDGQMELDELVEAIDNSSRSKIITCIRRLIDNGKLGFTIDGKIDARGKVYQDGLIE